MGLDNRQFELLLLLQLLLCLLKLRFSSFPINRRSRHFKLLDLILSHLLSHFDQLLLQLLPIVCTDILVFLNELDFLLVLFCQLIPYLFQGFCMVLCQLLQNYLQLFSMLSHERGGDI